MKKNKTNSTAIWVIGGLGVASIIGLLSMKKAKANVVPQPALPSPSGGASADFDTTMPFITELEGGYSTDKGDPGNYINGVFIGTKYGISAPTLKKWLGRTPTADEMRNLTKEDAYKIYYQYYWQNFPYKDIRDQNVANIIFDFTITSGKAIREVQKHLNRKYKAGLAEDNIIGSKTIAAINSISNQRQLFEELKTVRISYYQTLSTWSRHGNGWTNRVNKWVYA